MQSAQFLFFLSIPSMKINRNNLKIQIKILGQKIEKKARGLPLAFFHFFAENFLYEFTIHCD